MYASAFFFFFFFCARARVCPCVYVCVSVNRWGGKKSLSIAYRRQHYPLHETIILNRVHVCILNLCQQTIEYTITTTNNNNSTLTGNVHLSSFSDNTGHWERRERDYSHSVRFRFQSQPLSSSSTCTKHILCHKIPRLLSSFEASQKLRCVFALKKEIVSNPKWKWGNSKWWIWMQNKSNILPLKELNISLEAIWTDSSLNSSEEGRRKKLITDTDLNKLIAAIHRASRLNPITENRKPTPVEFLPFLGIMQVAR